MLALQGYLAISHDDSGTREPPVVCCPTLMAAERGCAQGSYRGRASLARTFAPALGLCSGQCEARSVLSVSAASEWAVRCFRASSKSHICPGSCIQARECILSSLLLALRRLAVQPYAGVLWAGTPAAASAQVGTAVQMHSMLCRWGDTGSVCRGCGVLPTAPRGALPPCDAPGRDVAIPVTRAAVQTCPQAHEERGQRCHPSRGSRGRGRCCRLEPRSSHSP